MKYAYFLFAAIAAAQPNFKIDTKLVPLLVNVKNAAGEVAGSLDRSEFSVFDNDIVQEIAIFERYTVQPLSVSILLDISGSTAKDLRYETTSIAKFLRALFGGGNPRDTAALYSFNYDVNLLRSFTRSQHQLEDSMRFLHPEGGTSLYDAIHFASRDLQGRDGRHVMVIVSDGGNTTSSRKYPEALSAVHRASAILFPIVVVPITNDAGRNIGGEHALQTLSSSTGGRCFYPNVEQLDQAFADILRDLRAQYMIGYYPQNLPKDTPRFHKVRVELNRKDLRAFTRTGYYEDDPR
jgi:Ca-activated chloride channel family protein